MHGVCVCVHACSLCVHGVCMCVCTCVLWLSQDTCLFSSEPSFTPTSWDSSWAWVIHVDIMITVKPSSLYGCPARILYHPWQCPRITLLDLEGMYTPLSNLFLFISWEHDSYALYSHTHKMWFAVKSKACGGFLKVANVVFSGKSHQIPAADDYVLGIRFYWFFCLFYSFISNPIHSLVISALTP